MRKLLTILLLLPSMIFAQDKFALVVGNSSYKDAPLKNTINDARDISNKFQDMGYSVTTLTNANREEIETTVHRVSSSLPANSQVVFYYAGHAVQVEGSNYLIPVNENITSESSIKYKGVNLDYILDEFNTSPAKTNIVVLDSCRDNPYKDSSRGSGTRGLKILNRAPATGSEVKNSIVIYATAEGKTADDGEGRNSPFTQAFLKHMAKGGETIQDVMTYVSRDVIEVSGGEQFPQISNSSIEKIYLTTPERAEVIEVAPVTGYGSVTIDVIDSGTLYFNGEKLKDVESNSSIEISDVEVGVYLIKYITNLGTSSVEVEILPGKVVYAMIPSLNINSENEKILASLRLEKKIVEESIIEEEEKLESLKNNFYLHENSKDLRDSRNLTANRAFLLSVISYVGAGISGYYLWDNYKGYRTASNETTKEEYRQASETFLYLTGGTALVGLISSGVSSSYRKKVQEFDFNRDNIFKMIEDQKDEISRLKSKRQNIALKIDKYSR